MRRWLSGSLVCFILAAMLLIFLASPGAGIPVLTYHQIGDEAEWWCVSAADFEKQLIFLREDGYTAISVIELAEGLAGRRKLPKRPVVITFDDGYEDNYQAAFPILERQGMRGTFFVVTGRMGKPGYMSWQQVKEMSRRRMELGSHTVNHFKLKEISLKELERELVVSRLMLENNVPDSAPVFANPFGETAPAVVELLSRTGYQAACSSVVGINRPGENPYMIRRMSVLRPKAGLWEFRIRLWLLNMRGRLGI